MPNKKSRHKRVGAATRSVHGRSSRKGDSVKTFLEARIAPALARVSQQAARQKEWRKWLEKHLGAVEFARISGVVERGDTLVVFTESAAWSARVRYAIAEIEPLIKNEERAIRRVEIRVMPRS
jgi:hypothetical protein